jgi:long-chain acyl-CoA synthetase
MPSRTVHHLLIEAAERYGSAAALHQPVTGHGERHWRALSWIEYREAVEEIAAGLRRLGLRRGDIVALDADTKLEFYLADLGVMVSGCVAAALYTSYPAAEQVKTLRACDAKAIFVDNPKMLAALLSAAEPPLDVQWILLTGEADGAMTLAELRESGRKAILEDAGLIDRIRQEVQPDDYAILYLTSGATGEPKMGLARHSALVANCDIGAEAVPLGPDHRSIAFLPSAHITQRVAMELFPLRLGMPVWFSEGLSRLPHELKVVKPTFFVAPPRVWERMYASICTELKKRGAITQKIFYGALGLGLDAARRRQNGKPVPGWMQRLLKMSDKAVFGKIRERLGGAMQMAVSGAAPLGKDLADFYAAIGLPIHEGYGLTEGGIVALNPAERPRSGSIGKALPRVEMKIAADGELVFRSPTLFSGYYKDPEATAAVLQDGWLHTGEKSWFPRTARRSIRL